MIVIDLRKGFASTNIVLGVGSYTYQMNTRDTLGFAAKGAWFQVEEPDWEFMEGKGPRRTYSIFKDPVTDDGTKKSLKGLLAVHEILTIDSLGKTHHKGYKVQQECSEEDEDKGELQVIFEDGRFYNQTSLTHIRAKINSIL